MRTTTVGFLLIHIAAHAAAADEEEGNVRGTPAEASLGKQFSEGLRNQHMRVLESRGESITIMAVGESGLGKTSLLSSLFRAELLWPDQEDGHPTASIAEQTVTFDLEGLPFSAKLIDTPGYGDTDVLKEFDVVLGRLNQGFRRVLAQERRIRRADRRQSDAAIERVDVVLYFFAPHRCKKADVALLKLLKGRASVVPILAKADSMTAEELASFRQQVTNALLEANVPVAHPPVSVITASRPAGGEPLGREYPWGLAMSESRNREYVHSELDRLRRFLLIDGLLDLKQATQEHYEQYRANRLRRDQRGFRALIRALLSPLQLLAASLLLPKPRRLLSSALSTLAVSPAKVLVPFRRLPGEGRRALQRVTAGGAAALAVVGSAASRSGKSDAAEEPPPPDAPPPPRRVPWKRRE